MAPNGLRVLACLQAVRSIGDSFSSYLQQPVRRLMSWRQEDRQSVRSAKDCYWRCRDTQFARCTTASSILCSRDMIDNLELWKPTSTRLRGSSVVLAAPHHFGFFINKGATCSASLEWNEARFAKRAESIFWPHYPYRYCRVQKYES